MMDHPLSHTKLEHSCESIPSKLGSRLFDADASQGTSGPRPACRWVPELAGTKCKTRTHQEHSRCAATRLHATGGASCVNSSAATLGWKPWQCIPRWRPLQAQTNCLLLWPLSKRYLCVCLMPFRWHSCNPIEAPHASPVEIFPPAHYPSFRSRRRPSH